MKTRKKIEVEYDASNKSCSVTYAMILRESCAWVIDTNWCYPSMQEAMAFMQPQIDEEFKLVAPGIYEADLKPRNDLGDGKRRALKVRLTRLMVQPS